MEETKTLYALYAMPLTPESIEAAASKRFSRATPVPEPGYVLVYTDKEAPKGAIPVNTAEETKRLTDADIRWLCDSRAVLIAEELRKHEAEILETLSEKTEALEKELQKRKQELKEKGE